MPDLIIKPTNTSGNKVIIQDQGAVTRLQTDDAGITITAPTIASMANCTFPAGTIVYVQTFELAGSDDTSTSIGWDNSGLQITIPSAKVALGSKIFVTYSHAFGVNQGTGHRRIDYKLQRTDPTDHTLFHAIKVGLTANDDNGTEHIRFNSSASGIDDDLGTGDHVYKLQFRKSEGTSENSGNIYYRNNTGAILNMTAMVIV